MGDRTHTTYVGPAGDGTSSHGPAGDSTSFNLDEMDGVDEPYRFGPFPFAPGRSDVLQHDDPWSRGSSSAARPAERSGPVSGPCASWADVPYYTQ